MVRKDVTEHTRSGHSTLVPFSLELNVIDHANYYISLRCFLYVYIYICMYICITKLFVPEQNATYHQRENHLETYLELSKIIQSCNARASLPTIHTGSIWISKSTRLWLWRVVTSMHSFEVVNVPVYHVICYLPSHAAPQFSKTLFFQGMMSCYLIWKRGAAVGILQEGTCQSANMPTLWYIPDFIIRSHLIETHFLILVCYSWVASFKRWFWVNTSGCWTCLIVGFKSGAD